MKNVTEFLSEPAPRNYDLGLHAFCKINLGLRVGPRREDGYHEILTVFQTINFADTLYARPRARGFRLRIVRRGAARSGGLTIPTGKANLVLRAARLAGRFLGERQGAELLLIKRVPAGSGLGGGSSDGAATLRLLARLWGRRLSVEDRSELAANLGSDCAFFAHGGRAVARGRGEILEWKNFPYAESILLAIPRRGLATRNIYVLFDQSNRLTVRPPHNRFSSPPPSAAGGGSARSLMPNELEEVVCRHYPDVGRAKELLNLRGVAAIQMSGSGSAVFGILSRRVRSNVLVPKQHQKSLEVVRARFNRTGSRWCR